MARPESEVDPSEQNPPEDNNILTGDKERVSPKKLLVQKVLRCRGPEELNRTEHPEYKVFMPVGDTRGNILFQRSPDGEDLLFEDELIEKLREGGEIKIRRIKCSNRHIEDALPKVAQKFCEFLQTGEV